MLSRVADSLYWMSRYLERAEHIARMVDVYANLKLETDAESTQQRIKLLYCLGLEEAFIHETDEDEALFYITLDTQNPTSIITSVASARENARQVREQISSEMWTQLNTLYLQLQEAQVNEQWAATPHNFYLEVRSGSHLFQGITDATMNHDQGWHFIQLGRYVERALNLVDLLDVHLHNTLMEDQQRTLQRYFEYVGTLKSVSAFEAYCKVYNPNLRPAQIAEFLLFNREFPRSARFCVDQILVSLHALADATSHNRNERLYRIAGRLQSLLSFDEVQDIDDFHLYLMNIKQQIYRIHDTLYKTFINYAIDTAL